MNNRYYLAYGSNLNVEQMEYRCPTARPVGIATIPDYELLFKGSLTGNYLTIEKCKGESVPVVVWETSFEDELSLDRYEGYPNFYYKKKVTVEMLNFDSEQYETVEAYVYIMHEDHKLGVPTTYYMRTCVEGYVRFGFDTGKLNKAYLKSQKGGKSSGNYKRRNNRN